MPTTIPDTEHIIPAEAIAQLPAGMKLALISKLAESLAHDAPDPNEWYSQLARFGNSSTTDWGTIWAVESDPSGAPAPPEDFHESLPGLLHNWKQANRSLDNIMLSLSNMADRALSVDPDAILGIPPNIRKWRTGHGYIADQLGIETRQAAQYRDRAEIVRPGVSALGSVAQDPLLPLVANSYLAGEIPPESIDTIARSLKVVEKYLRAVNLTPDNIRDIFGHLDAAFRNAATTVKPAELAKMTDDILAQTAAIVDADGPPPEEVLKKVENSLRYRIADGKLHVHITTDILNLELLLGIIYAGLNFRAHHQRYHASPKTAQDVATHVSGQPEAPAENAAEDDPVPEPAQSTATTGPPVDEHNTAAADQLPPDQSFLHDVKRELPDDPSPEEILAAAERAIDAELQDPTVYAESMDGESVTKSQMRQLDPRSRHEKLHDIFFSHMRATGRLDPSIQGLSMFGGAATQLRLALDYETFASILGDRLQPEFALPTEQQRTTGLDGFDPGAPRTLHGAAFAAAQIIETVDDDGTAMIEIDLAKYSDGDGKLRVPKVPRGHPFIARTTHQGTIAPQRLRALLCDAEIIPQVLGTGNVVLDRGRAIRTYPPTVKRDLATYGSCSIPDCRAPAAHTDAHHLIWWSRGGKTSSDNVTLLCPRCHTLVHHKVWTPVFDANGQLYWKPAPWLDPTQTPLRNTYWD